jgi:hypothetical protein
LKKNLRLIAINPQNRQKDDEAVFFVKENGKRSDSSKLNVVKLIFFKYS